MRTPTFIISMGGPTVLIFLVVASLCVGGGAVDRGRARHIRRITAADLPATPGNLTNATAEVPQPGQLIVTEVFNKNTSKDLSSLPKELEGNDKPSVTISKDLDTNTASSSNSKDITKFNLEAVSGSHKNGTTLGGIDSEKDAISVEGSEYSSSISVPGQPNVTEVFRGNTKSNISSEFSADDVKTRPTSTVTNSGSNETTKLKELVKEGGTNNPTRTKEPDATEALLTSSSTYRRRRPVGSNTTSTTSNSSQDLASESQPKSSKEVNINEVVSNRSSSRRLRKPILLIRKNGVVVANHTRAETETIASKNCTEGENDCEVVSESDGGSKTVVELSEIPNSTLVNNSSAEEVVATNSKENSIDTTSKPRPNNSSTVRPTDGAFNNIDFSSTARMVLQEKIHEDILHHLTTVSYAHYETDYVMDDDADAFDAESQSSSSNASTVTYGNYDTGASATTTPRVDSFDETYARISEGIQHNLDEIEERSVEFDATSERNEDHFGSSSDTDSSRVLEKVPKNETRLAVEYTNHVDIIANNSAVGNAKLGALTVANETHVDLERSFVESKVIPEVTSTFKFLIDDEYSTTTIIPSNENSEEESNTIKEGRNGDQSLESAEDDAVTASPDKTDETNTTLPLDKGNASTESPGYNNRTNLLINTNENQTITTLKSQGRGRMFPSERIHVNNTNNVDQGLPDSTEGKRLRSRTSQESNSSNDSSQQTEDKVNPRSRSYLLRETSESSSRPEPSLLATRRMSTVTAPETFEPTSPRSNYINTGRPSSRYPPQVNYPYRQGVTVNTQEIPSSTSPRVNLLRPGRYPVQVNTTYIRDDVMTTTSPRSNLILAGRPSSSRYPSPLPGNNSIRQVGGTRNDEVNDIPANNTPPARSRGETRFAGVSTSSLTNEEYPIPPTAAAWSLVTMKEPSVRMKVTGAGMSPSTTLQLVENDDTDSHPSGSYSKLTTVYNILTPTASMDVTEKGISNIETTTYRSSLSTNSSLQNFNAGGLQFTTEDPNEGVTTQVPEFTTINTSIDEESETASPVDSTSSPKSGVVDDDAMRFDVGTTLPPGLEFAASTTQQSAVEHGEVMSTTLAPDTTPRSSKEDSDQDADADVLITTTETTGLLGFGYSDTGMPEDGQGEVSADTREGEEIKTREQQEDEQGAGGVGQQDPNQQMDDAHLAQGETDYGGPTGPDAGVDAESIGGSSTTPASSSSSLGDASREVQDMTTTLPDIQTTSNINADDPPETVTTTYDDVTAVYNSDNKFDNTPSTGDNQPNDTLTVNVTSTATTRTTDGLGENSTRAPPEDYVRPAKNIPSFLRVFVEASPRQFCETVGTFKKAVADLLTKGSGRIVSSDQVVLRNFGREQCSIQDDPRDNSTSATGLLLPVELHLVDEAVNFDRQLNEAFTLIWGQEGMDFPLRILKVDVVATPDDFMASSVDKAGVIAAIAISCIGAVCLLLLAVLLIVMRKRQKKFNYGMRCTPVSLDAYSLDSVSIHDSVRRKAGLRASKRSYGNPAFDDPSAPSHSLNFAGLSAFSTERGAMEDEFARIPHVTPKADELPPGAETKNRYANVLPLPETRVILSSQPQEQLGDYINANYVAGPKNAANFYIACQAPLLSTVIDFWRMIWEQQSKVIMMLTELVENGVEKCADYLPPSEVLDCHRLFGDFQVTLKKREVREKYVISTLQLKNLESNSWREITHLWYVSWPSQGVPEEPNSMIAFLIEARSYMKNRSGPSVVHCSPGTGRTGTVLACDLSIREFEHTRQVDIPRCVARLRRDRAGCVQTRDQYAFIYQVLNLYATKLTGGALDSI